MKNQAIRETAKRKGVKLWEIAERLEMCDYDFSRKLRKEFPEDERERVLSIIEEIHLEHEGSKKYEQAEND